MGTLGVDFDDAAGRGRGSINHHVGGGPIVVLDGEAVGEARANCSSVAYTHASGCVQVPL